MRSPPTYQSSILSAIRRFAPGAIILVAFIAVASCTNPFVTSIAYKPTGVGIDSIMLETMSDFEEFFSSDSPVQLTEDKTLDAASIAGASDFRWSVNGLAPGETETPHVSVGEDARSISVNREHEDFELSYPVGTTISITLRLRVESHWYSGTCTLLVVARDSE